jgi:hypothetical protein
VSPAALSTSTMPIAGLPAEVSILLETLLSTKKLTSYQVTGDNKSSTVILRLSTPVSDDNLQVTDSRHTCHPDDPARVIFRKKTASQQRRDRKRAQEHQRRKQQEAAIQQAGAKTSYFGLSTDFVAPTLHRPTYEKSAVSLSSDSGVTSPAAVSARAELTCVSPCASDCRSPLPHSLASVLVRERDLVTPILNVNNNIVTRGVPSTDFDSVHSCTFSADSSSILNMEMTNRVFDTNRQVVSYSYWEKPMMLQTDCHC